MTTNPWPEPLQTPRRNTWAEKDDQTVGDRLPFRYRPLLYTLPFFPFPHPSIANKTGAVFAETEARSRQAFSSPCILAIHLFI